jgi:ribosomal protein L24E
MEYRYLGGGGEVSGIRGERSEGSVQTHETKREFFPIRGSDNKTNVESHDRSNLMLSAAPKSTRPRFVLVIQTPSSSVPYLQLLTQALQQGKIYVRGDSKVFRFFNGKSESLFLQRKNPRRIAWTILFRRMHKKGISEVRLHSPTRLLHTHSLPGSYQEAYPPHSQVPAPHRRSLPRCD